MKYFLHSMNNDSKPLLEEVVKLDPKKISLPTGISLQDLPDIKVTLHELTDNYYEINVEGNSLIDDLTLNSVEENSLIDELCIKVPGTENARTMFFGILDDLKRGEYTTKTEFKVKITPKYYRKHFS